jgi:hypothetical protein
MQKEGWIYRYGIILANVLEHIDSIDLFDRTEAYPFHLLDGQWWRLAEEYMLILQISSGLHALENLTALTCGKFQKA